jgi:3-methyladenine DNA glycosylase AlkD
MPTLAEAMAELESYGKPTHRKTYVKHGLGDNTIGVPYSELKPMAKRLKGQHKLALELWDTDVYDARILAAMIADPKQATPEMLNAWARSLANHAVADELSKFASKTAHARTMAEAWAQDAGEWISTAGWDLLGQLALNDKALPDSYFEPYIDQIEGEIHSKPNRTRYAMNSALIAFGTRSPALEGKALAAASAIGEVYVDHGQTNCETPDACAYIQKVVAKKGHLVTG